MDGNTKQLVFGVCVALLMLGAFVGAASASAWYVDGDGAIAVNGYSKDVLGLNIARWLAGAEEGEIKFAGTAIEYFEASMPGAPWGWTVSVGEMISGPQPCSNQLNVTLVAVAPPWGYMDPNIVEGDKIEVYGAYYEHQSRCGVSLVGSEDYYIKKADDCDSLVKFTGTATTDEDYDEFVCYGSYYCTVKVEEVLQDPDNTLVSGHEYQVCYGATQNNIKTGDKVEVFGNYFPTCGPLQCVGNIVASGDGYYVEIIAEEAVNFIGVVENEPSEPCDIGVRIDEVLLDPEGVLSIGDLANIDIADDISECDVVWPVHEGDMVEVCAKHYDYGCWLPSYDICVWIYSKDSVYDGYLKLVGVPDLIIQDISWSPSSPEQGDAITFTVTTKNQGAASAGNSTVKYHIDGSYTTYDLVPALSAGSTSTQTFTWTADRCGDVQVKAVADANNAVSESNEGNNERTETVNVEYTVTSLRGDLNGDWQITSADMLIALQIAVSGEYRDDADVDRNGYVNALDARMIMQAAAGRIEL